MASQVEEMQREETKLSVEIKQMKVGILLEQTLKMESCDHDCNLITFLSCVPHSIVVSKNGNASGGSFFIKFELNRFRYLDHIKCN